MFEKFQEPITKNRLNLPFAISEELSRLTTLELKCSTDPDLDPEFQHFLGNISHSVTKGLLFGSVIFKPFIRGDKVRFCAVTPENFKILKWDELMNIPTVTEFYERKGGFVRVERHETDGIRYTVRNTILKNGREVTPPDFWAGYAPYVSLKNVSRPLFGLFATSDYAPVYMNALPLIQDAERQYERLMWEFESGERALYVADTAFLKDLKGNPKIPDKRLYRLLSTTEDNLFHDFTPTFRDEAITRGLDVILKRIEDSCSLSRGTFSSSESSIRTATELKMAQHRTYTKVSEFQKSLEIALKQALKGAATLLCLYGERKNTEAYLEISFGDSILNTEV